MFFFFSGLHIRSVPRRMLWEVHTDQLCGVQGRDARGHTGWGETQTGECVRREGLINVACMINLHQPGAPPVWNNVCVDFGFIYRILQ